MQHPKGLAILVAIAVCGCTHHGEPAVDTAATCGAVVDSLVAEISAIAEDYPELEGFEEKASTRQDRLQLYFDRNVKRFAEMRHTRPDDVGQNGISLSFVIHDEDHLVWTTIFNQPVHLKHMKKKFHSTLVLSPDAPDDLRQELTAILDKHMTMLEEYDEGLRNATQ